MTKAANVSEVKLDSSNFVNGVCPFIFGNNVEANAAANFEMSCYINKPLNELHKSIEQTA